MEWSYVAGLFDGEGCATLSFVRRSKESIGIRLETNVYIDSDEGVAQFTSLLSKDKISIKDEIVTNHFGKGRRISIHGWRNVELFLNKILPYAIIKRPQIEIALTSCRLRKELLSKNERLHRHLNEFDSLRHELHSYAKKGIKTLKPLSVYLPKQLL